MFSFSRFEHEYTKSCFRYREPISTDFRVFANGQEIPVYTCRISKYPFNRVWPGFQRPYNQTVGASFVNLVGDEELKIEVEAARAHERVLLKPYSKGICPVEQDGNICFTLKENGCFVLELDGYAHCLYIFYSKPICCEDPSAVTYYFGPGVHMPGKIVLQDNDSVYIDKDALVLGCLFAENAKHIRIFGNGLLDDTGEGRVSINCYEEFTNGNVKFYDCEDLSIEGVLMRNSAIWCVNLFHCFDVTLDNIKVFGQWRYNTDGVDVVNSQNIFIRNSFIHAFDDAISIKGIDRYIQTDNVNIHVENCILWCDWGKTCEVGIETACREYRNISFRNCDILRGGNGVLSICNGDCAEMSDILFENICVEYNAFDTPEVLQIDDDQVYDVEGEHMYPYLIYLSNRAFRSSQEWGIPLRYPESVDLTDIQSRCVHDVTYRHIRVFYDEKLPLMEGKYYLPIRMTNKKDTPSYWNISISDMTVNGVPLTKENTVATIDEIENFTWK